MKKILLAILVGIGLGACAPTEKEALVVTKQGPKGSDGVSGTNGTNGTDGTDGVDGADGQNGYNALIKQTMDQEGCVTLTSYLDTNRNLTYEEQTDVFLESNKICPLKSENEDEDCEDDFKTDGHKKNHDKDEDCEDDKHN